MKVCKCLWHRLLALSGAAACLLLLGYLSADGQDPSVSASAGQTVRVLYAKHNPAQAGLRSIKVVDEDYLRSSVPVTQHQPLLPKIEEADDFLSTSGSFRKGDFDYHYADDGTGQANASLQGSQSPSPLQDTKQDIDKEKKETKIEAPSQSLLKTDHKTVTVRTLSNESIVEDGMYWSKRLEDLVPPGISDEQVASFLAKCRVLRVQRLLPPTWNRCGRPKNQFVVLSDGTQACARYRAPHNYLIQGEVMSFYLSRLLGIQNVPTVCLSPVSRWMKWPTLNGPLEEAGWELNATVALIQWVDGLERDRMPGILLDAFKNRHALTSSSEELQKLDDRQLMELLQWTDLILFDYITGNYDRVASMQDAADREQRPAILHETIHNLVKSRETQSLWLIDNESGLLDSYALLYGQGSLEANQRESRFVAFHREMLESVCIFRRQTFRRLRWLRNLGSHAAKYLQTFVSKREPEFENLPSVFSNREFVKYFHRRIFSAYQHMKQCHGL